MKKVILFLALLTCPLLAVAQKGISYQAIILDPKPIKIPGQDITGQPFVNGAVSLKFRIYSANLIQEFEEVHTTQTDAYGTINVLIGSQNPSAFSSLVWDSKQKSLQVLVSFDQGGTYTKVSEQQLTFNPMALFAETASKLSETLSIAGGGTGATTAAAARTNLVLGNVDNTSDANKPISTATQNALDTKANANEVTTALATKANAAEVTSALATKANASEVNTALATKANAIEVTTALATKASAEEVATALATKANASDVSASLALKEDVSNKANTPLGSSTTLYPTQSAVKTYVDAQVAAATIGDANGSTKGKIQLAGDLAGTAAAPTVPGLALKANTNDVNSSLALKAPIASPSFTGSVVVGTATPSASAALDINSTSQGMLVPRMTTVQRNAIATPASALLIFNTSNNTFEVYKTSCSCWVSINDGGSSAATNLENNAPSVSNINYKGTFRVGSTANVVYTYSDAENDAEALTTILWEIANDNIGTARTTYSTSANPTFGVADAGRYVRVKVTPRAATGVLNGIDNYGTWTLIDAATVPSASMITLSGSTEQGSLLSGTYTFAGGSGIENALGSTYTWQAATSSKGANTSTMSIPDGGAAFGKTIRPTINEVNKYIRFGVRAKDNAPVTATSFVYSDWVGPISMAAEAAPIATDVLYSPAPGTNVELTGSYTYTDANNDPEATSVYQWYTATDASGASQTAISGAMTKKLILTTAQAGKYIGFSVTPKALTGSASGAEAVYYSSTPSVAAADFTLVSVTQSSTNFSFNRVMDATDFITVRINVTSPGAIAFSTPTVNGYSLSNGGVYATGAQNVILYAKGTQTAYNAAGDVFAITAVGSSTQTSTITIKNAGTGTVLANNVPTVNNINYKGLYRVGGTANVVYTYADTEKDAEGATTIMWEIANDANGTARTTLSTSATPTFVTANAGKYVRVKITPRATTGLLNGIDYYGGWTLIEAANVPYSSAVSVTGNTEQSSLLTGSYTFNGGTGVENTVSGSIFNWQSATSDKGANTSTMVIPDGGLAFGKTIKPTIAEVNRFIRFGVRARDNASTAATNFAYSDWIGPITLAPETAPTATNVTLSQAPNTNLEINGLYTYNDINNDPEGASVYQWYTATDNQGANKTAISGATSQSFYIDNSKIGSIIGFGVTPKALTGNQTGTEVVYFNPTSTSLSVPLVTNTSFSGSQLTGFVGTTLTGTYSYSTNGSEGTENGTIQKWYTANNVTDAGTLVGTGNTYSPNSADLGKYIIFEVTPVSSTGATGVASRFLRYAGTEILGFTTQAVQAAYSLRKLRASYTGNAIQVRRSSDNTTRDIGFTSTGLLDEAALTSFVTNNGVNPTANGFVSIWYDQSGNGRDVSNPTVSEQPIIATSGTLEKYNGLPTVKFVRASSTRLFKSTNFNDRFYATAAMGVFAYTAATKYLSNDGLLTSVEIDVNTLRTIAFSGEPSATTLSGFGNPAISTATFYRNKVVRATQILENGPIQDLSVLYVEYPTSSVSTENGWIGVQIGRDRNIAGRNWGGPVSELILFEQNFRESNYVEVLKIQDAQMLYYLGK
jgi:hypothetical protein